VVGDVEALADRIRALVRAGHRVVLAAEGDGSARRLVLAREQRCDLFPDHAPQECR
jgi:hypothetical protein